MNPYEGSTQCLQASGTLEQQHLFEVYLTLTQSHDIIYRKFFGNLVFDNNTGMDYEKRHGFPQHTNISA